MDKLSVSGITSNWQPLRGNVEPNGSLTFCVIATPTRTALHRKTRGACKCEVRERVAPPSVADLKKAAEIQGLCLEDRSFGPWISCEVARDGVRFGSAAGYVVPGLRRLHIDALWTTKIAQKRGALLQANASKIMILYLLARATAAGAEDAYGLAIKDDEEQHRRLIQFGKRMGFSPVRKVGNRIQDVPDRLVWGGEGMLFRAKIDDLYRKWVPLLERVLARG